MASGIKPRAVYKLVRTDKPEDDGTDVYVGSTSQSFKKRLEDHKGAAKLSDSKLYTRMREVGIYNWRILPLVVCPCDQDEIQTLERQWVEILNADLNVILPFKENNERNRERAKNHYYDSIESKRYFCNVCDKAFGKLCHLKTHFKTEKHKNKSFEQLIEGVYKMIQEGIFSQVLENSKETTL